MKGILPQEDTVRSYFSWVLWTFYGYFGLPLLRDHQAKSRIIHLDYHENPREFTMVSVGISIPNSSFTWAMADSSCQKTSEDKLES